MRLVSASPDGCISVSSKRTKDPGQLAVLGLATTTSRNRELRNGPARFHDEKRPGYHTMSSCLLSKQPLHMNLGASQPVQHHQVDDPSTHKVDHRALLHVGAIWMRLSIYLVKSTICTPAS